MTSIRGALFREFLRYRTKRLYRGRARPIAEVRARLDRWGARLPLPQGTRVARVQIEQISAEWILPVERASSGILLYLHGGGYSAGSAHSHRGLVAQIAAAAGVRALLPEYRLAPEHPFPAALEDVLAVYRHLLAKGVPPYGVVLAGDSAGGGLAVAASVALRDRGVPLPAGAVLISPWTDLAGTGESLRTRARQDPWLQPQGMPAVARLYHGETPPTHPLVSPLYAALEGLPPMLIHVGDCEILLSDATRLAEKARQAGVPVSLKVWPGMFHVFHAFYPFVPEARKAIRAIGQWIRVRLQAADPALSFQPLRTGKRTADRDPGTHPIPSGAGP